MLLRSSSTPVLGSLLSSFSETPNNRRYSNSEVPNITTPEHASTSIIPHHCGKISYNKYASAYTSSSSPISPSVSESRSGNSHVGGGFRRAQSEGNLEALAAGVSSNDVDDFNFSTQKKKLTRRAPRCSTLEAIPSFSSRNCSRNGEEDEEDSEGEEEDLDEQMMGNDTGAIRDSADAENLCFEGGRANSGFEKEGATEMYLARGLGISGFNFVDIGGSGGGGGQGYRPVAFGGDGGEGQGFVVMEEHYKKMLEENPGNPLCLRNYAQFCHQTKKDLGSAEEYYCRAILADPTDGEVLCQYAKLIWELHHDAERSRDYFERAVRAAGEDSHVQAAYACFLWETADEEDDEDCPLSDGPRISTVIKDCNSKVGRH